MRASSEQPELRRRALKGEFQATAEPQDHRGSRVRSTLRAQPQGLVGAPSHACARPRNTTDFIACRRGSVGAAGVNTAGAPLARPPHPRRAPRSPLEPAGLQNLLPSKQCVSHRLIFFDCFSKRAHLRRPGRANPLDPSADQGSVDRQDHGRESCVSRHARAGPYARRAGGRLRVRARTRRRTGSVGASPRCARRSRADPRVQSREERRSDHESTTRKAGGKL